MTSRRTQTDVPYSARQMYELVADIERYPEFIPWCVALRIVRGDKTETGGTLLADMIVSYKVFREQFRSKVTLDPQNCAIDAEYTDGPFETLYTQWRFTDRPEGGSTISFFIEFRFRSVLLQSTAHMVFEKAFSRMTEAFVARADVLYKKPDAGPAPQSAPQPASPSAPQSEPASQSSDKASPDTPETSQGPTALEPAQPREQ